MKKRKKNASGRWGHTRRKRTMRPFRPKMLTAGRRKRTLAVIFSIRFVSGRWHLMHVKCIHELCSLLPHIPLYLHHIYCYIHVFRCFLGIFQMIPLILVITMQDKKTMFCVFFSFRDLYGLKLTGDFSRIIIFQYMTKLSFGITETESRSRKEQGWHAPHPGRATCPLFPFGASQPSSKSSRRFP